MRTRDIIVAGAALIGAGFLAGCSNWSYDPPMRGNVLTEENNFQAVRQTAVTTPAGFNRDLATGYAALADTLRKERQWGDVDYFSRKGIAAARGDLRVPPESESNWMVPLEVPDQLRSQLADSRRRLMAALDAGAPQMAPSTAARAQVGFDCWIEHMESDWRAAAKSACHQQFVASLGELEKHLPARSAKAKAAPTGLSGSSTRQYRVYFDTEGAVPAAAAQPVLQEMAARAKEDPEVRFLLIGKADRTGTHGHNLTLSERRVEAVRSAMVAKGVPPARIEVKWVGERQPAVHTAEGVAELRNRVVEVSEQF
jgi:OmpA-OmpF porin, OOP family